MCLFNGIQTGKYMDIDIPNFVELDFSKQVHKCCLLYCSTNNLRAFRGNKPSSDYFKCRAYLMKLPRQVIKNIAIMLSEEKMPVYLYDMEKRSQEYVDKKREKANQSKLVALNAQQQYDMDKALLDFLG